MIVDLIIPALNEEAALPLVLAEVPQTLVRQIVVVDNGSSDGTATVARNAGATVLVETERGYGAACLRGLAYLSNNPPDVVAFVDGDHSDYPEELGRLLEPIESGRAEMTIGSRVLGGAAPGSLTPQQRVGNAIACHALEWFHRVSYTDLGPFRAIRWDALQQLRMQDRNFGWTVEMQIRAAQEGLRYEEVPVRYRPRIGVSKVSGTVLGSFHAGRKILWLLGRHAVGRSDRKEQL
ncbi:MAG: glycosyltransferase family 2 protein [Myxococcota bacterium]